MAIDKAVDSTKLNACLTAEANAIRAKTGGSAAISFDLDNSKGFADSIAAISSGGGVTPAQKKDVNFYDQGIIIYSYTAQEAAALTELPANPTHAGLTSQGWNYTLEQMKAEVTAQGKCDVGQMYITDDGKTRLYCHFEAPRLSPYLGLCVNGTVTVDWGDGSATSALTGTSLSTIRTVKHTFPDTGDYMITIEPASGAAWNIRGSTSTNDGGSRIFGKATNASGNLDRVYLDAIKRVELGSGIGTLESAAFYYCNNLESITIPREVHSIQEYAFGSCRKLSHLTIPKDTTILSAYLCSYNSGLNSISIPCSISTIDSYSLIGCFGLGSIVIPGGVTSFQNNACQNLQRLASITITGAPAIGANAFSGCYGLGAIHFKSSTPPTVSNSNAFTYLPTDCKIYVPAGKLSAYTGATNYPSSSTYTYLEE